MSCSASCSASRCYICKGCLEQHCICTSSSLQTTCRESRVCSCPFLSHCPKCLGCIRTSNGHCRCKQHVEQLQEMILSHSSKSQDDDNDDASTSSSLTKSIVSCTCPFHELVSQIEKKRVDNELTQQAFTRMTPLPTTRSTYDRKILGKNPPSSELDQSSMTTYPIYDYRERDSGNNIYKSWNPVSDSIRLNGNTLGYANSIEPAWSRREVRPNRPGREYHNKDIEMDNTRWITAAGIHLERKEALPKQDLIDYVVYLASIQSTAVPELIGSFTDTAAVAIAVIIEEYLIQTAEEINANEHHLSESCITSILDHVLESMQNGLPTVRQLKKHYRSIYSTLNQRLYFPQSALTYHLTKWQHKASASALLHFSTCAVSLDLIFPVELTWDTNWYPYIGYGIYRRGDDGYGRPQYGIAMECDNKQSTLIPHANLESAIMARAALDPTTMYVPCEAWAPLPSTVPGSIAI